MVQMNINVYKYKVSYVSGRDPVTGWRIPNYKVTTKQMIIVDRGIAEVRLPAGVHVSLDAIGFSADPWKSGDLVKTIAGDFYLVKGCIEKNVMNSFVRRDCDLNKLSMFEEAPGQATWKTSPNDARERAKTWLDAYLRPAEITLDDGSSEARFAVIFEDPPYAMYEEFRAYMNAVKGLYVLGESTSTPERSGDQVIRRYHESIIIHVMTITSRNCHGQALQHKMATELRYVAETYPEGSQRTLEPAEPNDRYIDGLYVYDMAYKLSYMRQVT